jgi:hypothetical protein
MKSAKNVVIGHKGRIENTNALRVQEVTKAFELLHSDDPESEAQLFEMLEPNE